MISESPQIRISFTVSPDSEMVGKKPKAIEEYFGVKVKSVASSLDGGRISFDNPGNDCVIEENMIITVEGERDKVAEVLKKGIVD